MPWQLLFRVVSSLFLWRAAARRRAGGAQRGGRGPAGATARVVANAGIQRRLRDIRETASLASRLVVVVGFATATALCLAGGTSSVVLSPRWLGGVLLGLGAVFAVMTLREARLARRLVTTRRMRRRDRLLRREVHP